MHYEEAGAIEDVSVLLWFRTRDDTAGVVDFDRSETWSLGIAFHRGDRNAGRLSWDTTAETSKTHDMLSPGSVADDAWRQAVVSYDASRGRKRIYVDGVLVAEQYAYPARTRLGSGATRYGFVGDGSEAGGFNAGRNNRYFVGDIAELAIWHRALSGGEVRSHYRMRSRSLP